MGDDLTRQEVMQLLKILKQLGEYEKRMPNLDWWSNHHLELSVMDPFDTTLSGLNFPSDLSKNELTKEARKSVVVDDVTMRDLNLAGLVSAISQTQTSVGYRMLEYLIHFPLRDLGEIRKRQAAVNELSNNQLWMKTLSEYFGIMAKNEKGFIEFTFPEEDGPPPRQETFQEARNYLAVVPHIVATLKQAKSDKLGEIRYNLEQMLQNSRVRKMYESVIRGKETDILTLHPDTWKGSLSERVIRSLMDVAPILRALAYADIKADLTDATFHLVPRKGEDPINIHYPLGLQLDLKKVRELYFDPNAIFNLYYSVGAVEALVSLAGLGTRLSPASVNFAVLRDGDRYDCNVHSPCDPYLLIKQGQFVPNNYMIDSKTRGFVITGPNTGGKTVYGFTLPKLQILVQAGASIPIGTGDLVVADYILTLRPDSREQVGEGRYLHSLMRGREILERATPRSLVAIDDFEGTDPEDCYKETLIIIEKLCRIGCAFTLTTQDRRIALEVEKNEGGKYNGVVPVQLKHSTTPSGEIKFFYKVIPGVGMSIGESAAKAAGMDSASLDRLMEQRGFNK